MNPSKKVNAKSEWLGLWDYGNGMYSGRPIRKYEIPPHAKLIVMENKYYKEGSDRPKYVYCFAAGNETDTITMKVDYKEQE